MFAWFYTTFPLFDPFLALSSDALLFFFFFFFPCVRVLIALHRSGRDELGVMPILKMIGDSVFVLLEPFVMKVAQFFHRLVTSKAMDSPTLMDTLEVMRMCLHSTASISDREAAVIESDLASVVLRGPGRALQAAVHAWKISTDHSTSLLLPKQILETAYGTLSHLFLLIYF